MFKFINSNYIYLTLNFHPKKNFEFLIQFKLSCTFFCPKDSQVNPLDWCITM